MPVTTFSCRPSTHFMPGTWSSAATKCISLVPGLAKQVSTPAASSVFTRLFAPFILSSSRGFIFTRCRGARHRRTEHIGSNADQHHSAAKGKDPGEGIHGGPSSGQVGIGNQP